MEARNQTGALPAVGWSVLLCILVITVETPINASYSKTDEGIPQTTDDDRTHIADDMGIIKVCDSYAFSDAEGGKVIGNLVAETTNDVEGVGESKCCDAKSERAMWVGWNYPKGCKGLVHWAFVAFRD
jgi:hypothetical protein